MTDFRHETTQTGSRRPNRITQADSSRLAPTIRLAGWFVTQHALEQTDRAN